MMAPLSNVHKIGFQQEMLGKTQVEVDKLTKPGEQIVFSLLFDHEDQSLLARRPSDLYRALCVLCSSNAVYDMQLT